LLTGELRRPRTGCKNWQARNCITINCGLSAPRLLRNKDDFSVLHASVERVPGAKSKSSPDRTRKNDLPLAGNASLHGKNILPSKHGAAPLRLLGSTAIEGS